MRPIISSSCTSMPSRLIKKGKAYVCDLNADQIREYRGTLTEPGKESPYRNRSVEENLDLFARMRNGEFPDGSRTLRAKVDMASPEPEHARSRHVPDPACHTSPDRRRLVHLSDVRLGARAVRFDRGDHALDLHARVHGPPSAVRLVSGRAGHLPFAADRIRTPEPDVHGDEQAEAAPAGAGGVRGRVGRRAHADDIRPASARLHARIDSDVCRTHRRGAQREHLRDWRCSRTACGTT